MKLKTQFLVAIGVLIVVLVAMAVASALTHSRITRLQAQHQIAATLQQQANDLAHLSANYLLFGEPAQKARWETVFRSFSAEIDRLEPTGSYESQLIADIRFNAQRLQQVFADIASTVIAGTDGGTTGDPAFLGVSWSRMEVQDRQIGFSAARLEELLEDRVSRANTANVIVLFVMLASLGLLLLGGFAFMYRRIIAGLAVLRGGTEIVGRGDLDHVIPSDRPDEIGDLSRAFNTMTGDLKNVTASKAQLEMEMEQRKLAEAEQERLYAALQAQNEELRIAQEQTARLLADRNSLYERLQSSLVHVPQEIAGVRIGHLYRSATEQAQVGGDFYDVFEAKAGAIGLLIGDVAGHGVEAARIATLVKDTVHAFAYQSRRPRLVLRETNRVLVEKNLPGFVTAFLGFLDAETGRLTYSSAGHPPPLLTWDGRCLPLGLSGPPLGISVDAGYTESSVAIAPGSLLLLYTDGITEARRGSLFFGEDGLESALSLAKGVDIAALPDHLLAQALRFSDGRLRDDVAILAVSYLGPPGSGPSAGVAPS